MDLAAILLCVATVLGLPPEPVPEVKILSRIVMHIKFSHLLGPDDIARGARVNGHYSPPRDGRPGIASVEEIGPGHEEAKLVEAIGHEFVHVIQVSNGIDGSGTIAHSLARSIGRTCRMKLQDRDGY